MKLHQIVRRPLVTEKSNVAREEKNEVHFAVDPRATKHDIRRAIQEMFQVEVVEVRTARMPRRKRRVGRFEGHRPEWKKAMVRLAEGQTIELFEGI